MPKAKAFPSKTTSTRSTCDLCGLPLRAGRVEARFASGSHAFCCEGCRQVFTILLQAAGTPDSEAFRQSDLFQKCQESGIIPRTEADLVRQNAPPAHEAGEAPAGSVERLSLTLKIGDMWCPACAWLIETALTRMPGVKAATCNFVTDVLQVAYDPIACHPDRIVAAIRSFGYTAFSPEASRDQTLRRREWIRFGVSTFLTMNVMMLSFALYFGFFTELSPESVSSISWPMAAMATGVMVYGGSPFFRRAWRGLRHAAFSMEALVTVGALSAFGLSTLNLFSGSIHLYYDTACMLVTLVLLGKILELRAKEQVLEGLDAFLSLMPTKVRIVDEAFPEGRFVAAAQLAAGDFFRVDENEIVAADGIIVSGEGACDTSSVSGEALPVVQKPGDAIRSGSRVHRGSFTICAQQVGAESTLGQMIGVVEKTLTRKNPGSARTEKILQWFVPAILMLAAATGLAVWSAGLGLEASVLRAVTVAVISCPCACCHSACPRGRSCAGGQKGDSDPQLCSL